MLSSTNLPDQWLISTNSGVVHLEAGLHYRDEQGNLQRAEAVIESFPEGAIARKTAIKVIFSPDINTAGAIDILTPENARLRGTPLGLSYYDAASGKSVLIAQVRSAKAQIVAPNKLVYENFLDDVLVDAVYEIRKSGPMQMLVIREDLPPPSAYGLSDEFSRLGGNYRVCERATAGTTGDTDQSGTGRDQAKGSRL